MVHSERFEPPTPAFGGQCSIQLSYECMMRLLAAHAVQRQYQLYLSGCYFAAGATGTNVPRPQLAPVRMPAPLLMTVMISTEQSWLIEVL